MLENKTDSQKVQKKSALKTGLEALIAGSATYGLYQLPPDIVEDYYSNGLFKYISAVEGFVGDLVPFFVWEGLLIGASAGIFYLLGKSAIRGIKNIFGKTQVVDEKEQASLPASKTYSVLHTLRTFSVAALAITVLGGLNFNRVSVADKAQVRSQSFQMNLENLACRINETRAKMKGFDFDKDVLVEDTNASVNIAYKIVNGTSMPGPKRIKSSLLPLRKVNVGGITLGSIDSAVDYTAPDYFTVWAMGHEKCHSKGYLHEIDAEALNYVACLNSGNDLSKYCSMMHLFFLSVVYVQEQGSGQDVSSEIRKLNRESFNELKSFISSVEDTKYSRAVGKVSDAMQKVRGHKDTKNAYLTEVVPLLWAIDNAYQEGKLRKE